jgi:hypothetical protein
MRPGLFTAEMPVSARNWGLSLAYTHLRFFPMPSLKQNGGKCPHCAKQVWENCWSPWYKAFMETKFLNIDCPKLKEGVVITLTRPDPTSELTYPPFRLTDCDSALECGLIKGKDETPDWSLCPLYDSRFWS